jgi:hypothetical protein
MGIDFNREIVKMMLTDSRTFFEVPAVDFQLQNGVTIRPMELVRKIEGPLRTITEDSSARPAIREAPDAGRGRGGRRRRGRGSAIGQAPPVAQQPVRPPAGPPAEGGEGAQKRRRRRRRRGRGGAPGEGAPPASSGE